MHRGGCEIWGVGKGCWWGVVAALSRESGEVTVRRWFEGGLEKEEDLGPRGAPMQRP